jgi:hypothetical protein
MVAFTILRMIVEIMNMVVPTKNPVHNADVLNIIFNANIAMKKDTYLKENVNPSKAIQRVKMINNVWRK